jgi:hypothetical protein
MIFIATDPLDSEYQYDIYRIALYWRDFCRKNNSYFNADMKNLQQKGIVLLNHIIDSNFPDSIKAVVFRTLTIDSERRMKDIPHALEFAKKALKLKEAGTFWKEYFEMKIKRLENKLHKINH